MSQIFTLKVKAGKAVAPELPAGTEINVTGAALTSGCQDGTRLFKAVGNVRLLEKCKSVMQGDFVVRAVIVFDHDQVPDGRKSLQMLLSTSSTGENYLEMINEKGETISLARLSKAKDFEKHIDLIVRPEKVWSIIWQWASW